MYSKEKEKKMKSTERFVFCQVVRLSSKEKGRNQNLQRPIHRGKRRLHTQRSLNREQKKERIGDEKGARVNFEWRAWRGKLGG